jgi:hypothetical protein
MIREDFAEASAIRNLSPKASASLARRCLQGMIRDFWQVHTRPAEPRSKLARAQDRKTLFDEIEAIQEWVDPVTWQAIDVVRRLGNIGAHMELDVNVIVDVEPEEAERLLGLIEMLINEWYVARKTREERLQGIVALGAKKDAQLEAARNPAADGEIQTGGEE